MITAQSVSAKLKRLGFRGMRSDYRCQGIHVRNFGSGAAGYVSVSVDLDSDRAAARLSDEIGQALLDDGFTIITDYSSPASIVVSKEGTK